MPLRAPLKAAVTKQSVLAFFSELNSHPKGTQLSLYGCAQIADTAFTPFDYPEGQLKNLTLLDLRGTSVSQMCLYD